VTTELKKLEAKVDFFNSSLQFDLECYEENISLMKSEFSFFFSFLLLL